MKILIDNGHGRETPGKRSPDGRLLEYAQNRLLARGRCGVYRDSWICGKVGIRAGQVSGVCPVRPPGHCDRVQESVSGRGIHNKGPVNLTGPFN